jgi:ADP-heptose:LPS heptosyltransferase
MREEYDAYLDLTCPCTAHEVPHAEPIGRIDLFARHAGIHLEDYQIDYYISPEEEKWANDYIYQNRLIGCKLFLVQAHSSTSRRDLPINKLQRSVVGVLNQNPNARAIVVSHGTDSSNANWKLYHVQEMRDFDVRYIAAMMSMCEMVLCQDSSILHLAAALNKKTVSLFGPTDPRARVNTYPNAVAICPGQNLSCSPCWYNNNCNSANTCWKIVEEKLVIATAHSVLNNLPLPNSPDLIFYGDYKKQDSTFEVL